MKKDEMIVCEVCGRLRKRFVNNVKYCQVCYRNKCEEYSFYDYKVPKERLSGSALKICEMLIEEGINRKRIHEILGLNKVYVQQIINKYTKRVNAKGEEKPF